MEHGKSLHLWNVLTDGYFKGEMIPGSQRVPLDTIGHEVSAANASKLQAAQKLMDLGYTNVKAYEGRLEEWKNAGK